MIATELWMDFRGVENEDAGASTTSTALVVIATRLGADKTPGGDNYDVGPWTTRSTAGCRLAASSCYVNSFLSFKTKQHRFKLASV